MFDINVNPGFLKKMACLLLLFISACQNIKLVTPSSGLPTVVPTEIASTPTMPDAFGVTSDSQPKQIITTLPPFNDYIIYGKFETRTDYEIWAINPRDPVPRLITTNLESWGWSPSNKLWLFVGSQSIFIANADGSNVHAVYTYEGYQAIEPFWLTDDLVLFNAYKDILSLPPEIYSLDIASGVIVQLFPKENKFIQATFPSKKKWILAEWPIGSLTIVGQDNKTETFFADFLIPTNIFSPYPPIQHIDKLDKYLIKAMGPGEADYKLWLVSQQETAQVFFDPGSDGIDQFAVSPDEQYVALTFNTLNGVYLYIFSLVVCQT
jgi:hypothetical protein